MTMHDQRIFTLDLLSQAEALRKQAAQLRRMGRAARQRISITLAPRRALRAGAAK